MATQSTLKPLQDVKAHKRASSLDSRVHYARDQFDEPPVAPADDEPSVEDNGGARPEESPARRETGNRDRLAWLQRENKRLMDLVYHRLDPKDTAKDKDNEAENESNKPLNSFDSRRDETVHQEIVRELKHLQSKRWRDNLKNAIEELRK